MERPKKRKHLASFWNKSQTCSELQDAWRLLDEASHCIALQHVVAQYAARLPYVEPDVIDNILCR